jgi:tetratricopeptide (TPR) repeat protein
MMINCWNDAIKKIKIKLIYLIFGIILLSFSGLSVAEANKIKLDHYTHNCLINLNSHQEQQAKEDCSKALSVNPNNAQAYLFRGLAAYRMGLFEEAIADYNQVIKAKPYQMEAYYNRGLVYTALGDNLTAIEDFNQALGKIDLNQSQQLATIYNDRGIAYLNLKNLEQAIRDFHQAIRLDPDNSFFYYNRAFAEQQKGNYQQAIVGFSEALALKPHQADCYLHRGLAYYNLGYYQAALQDLNCACDCCQKQEKAHILALIAKIKNQLSQTENVLV